MLKLILLIFTLVISIVSTVDFCYSLNSKCNNTQIYININVVKIYAQLM